MTTEQKIYFATFGDLKFYGALERIKNQAIQFGIFNLLFIFFLPKTNIQYSLFSSEYSEYSFSPPWQHSAGYTVV